MDPVKDKVLKGPELLTPIPLVSYGKTMYKTMSEASPEEVMFIDAASGNQTTYRDFLDLSRRLAKGLQNRGYGSGDVIAVSSENSPLFFAPVAASFFLGAISAPLNHGYTQRELSHLIDIIRPRVVFCSQKASSAFAEQKRRNASTIETIIILDATDSHDGFQPMCDILELGEFLFEPIDIEPLTHVAAILCSSGTTGMPKGVMVTHDNLSARVNQLKDRRLNGVSHEVLCACLPFFHAYGFMMVAAGIAKRNTFVVMQRFEEEPFLDSIERYCINVLHIVPPIAHFLARSGAAERRDLSSLEEVLVGAAPLSAEIEGKLHERFPTIKEIRQGYGLTEATIALSLMPNGERRLGSSGKIVPGMSAYVRDLETGAALGLGETGELCFKGRLITKGYYRDEAATRLAYSEDGWLRTGDLGYYDRDGYLFVVDRLKELIKYKGFQVPPAELEAVLMGDRRIRDVGVVGKPEGDVGELATAFVVRADPSLTEAEVEKCVADQLSKPKHLHGGVRFVHEIPKNPSGKILRRRLREMLDGEKSKL